MERDDCGESDGGTSLLDSFTNWCNKKKIFFFSVLWFHFFFFNDIVALCSTGISAFPLKSGIQFCQTWALM